MTERFMIAVLGCIIINLGMIIFLSILIISAMKRTERRARFILHDVSCPEQYECTGCHSVYEYDLNEGCDNWHYCPECGKKVR